MNDPLKTGTVSYDVSVSPSPLAINVRLGIQANIISLKIDDVPGLGIRLNPKYSWNPVDDLLTDLGTLANLFTSAIASAVKTKLVGVSVNVYTVQPIKIADAGIALTFTPSNVTINNDGKGMLLVSSDISVS
jgi:hypothetical protein